MIRTSIWMWGWLVLVSVLPVAGQQPRLWRDNTGTFDAVAVLVGIDVDSVFLQLPDGRLETIPFFRLSENDRKYLQLPPFKKGVEKKPADGSKVLRLSIDPDFMHSDEPPLESIFEKLTPIFQSAGRGEIGAVSSRNGSEKLKLIGPVSSEKDSVHSGRPIDFAQGSVLPPAGDVLRESNSIPGRPPFETDEEGMGERAGTGLSSRRTAGNRVEPGIIAAEVSGASADPVLVEFGSLQAIYVNRDSMPVSLQTSLNTLLAEIRGTTDSRALRRQLVNLSRIPVPINDEPTIEALRLHLRVNDHYVRETVFQKIVTLSSPPDLETLRQALTDTSQTIRWKAYDLVGSDPRLELLPLLMERVQTHDRSKIISVISAFGEAAEPSLWSLLNSENAGLRLEVARLLSGIGTEKSLPALNRIAENTALPQAEILQAQSSIRSIETRR